MLRVLVADDSPVVRLTVARRLRAAGVEVVEAESCATAVSLDPLSVDCALLDLDLGDGFGTEIATRLRAHAAALPIAFFTSSTGDQTTLAASFGPVFSKPDDLEAAIDWAITRGYSGAHLR